MEMEWDQLRASREQEMHAYRMENATRKFYLFTLCFFLVNAVTTFQHDLEFPVRAVMGSPL